MRVSVCVCVCVCVCAPNFRDWNEYFCVRTMCLCTCGGYVCVCECARAKLACVRVSMCSAYVRLKSIQPHEIKPSQISRTGQNNQNQQTRHDFSSDISLFGACCQRLHLTICGRKVSELKHDRRHDQPQTTHILVDFIALVQHLLAFDTGVKRLTQKRVGGGVATA